MRIYRILELLLFVTPAFPAEFDPAAWEFRAPLELPVSAQSPQFVRLVLPSAVLANSREDLLDLRLVDESGTELAYALRKAEARTYEDRIPAMIINHGIDPGRFEQIMCDLGEGGQVSNQVLIHTSASNFVRRTEIAGSSDSATWVILRNDAYIFDQQDQRRHHHKLAVAFPDSTYRYLKVTVWLDGGPPLNITGAEVGRLKWSAVEPETIRTTIVQRSEDPERKTTDLIVETEMGNQHLEQCLLAVKQENFERAVTISHQDHRGAWVDHGGGTIHRFRIGPVIEENLSVLIPELNHRKFRVRIWNEDSPPLEVESMVMRRMPRLLIFSDAAAQQPWLYFGNDRAEPRRYDLGGALQRIELPKLPEVVMGAIASNPHFSPPTLEEPWTERHPALTWAALAVGILMLGGLLFRTVRDVKSGGE